MEAHAPCTLEVTPLPSRLSCAMWNCPPHPLTKAALSPECLPVTVGLGLTAVARSPQACVEFQGLPTSCTYTLIKAPSKPRNI